MRSLFLALCLLISYTTIAQIQTINNGESGLTVRNKINANDAYLDSAGVQRLDSLISTVPDYDSIGGYSLATASGTDMYTATVTPSFSAYTSGQRFNIEFTNANTGPATINLNSKGAVPLTKQGATALSAGDIKAGQILLLMFDGTNMQIVGDGGGGGETITASNGLTKMGSDIKLGGALTSDISFDNDSLKLRLTPGRFMLLEDSDSLSTTIHGNLALGKNAGINLQESNLVAYHNTLIGNHAGSALTTGFRNTLIGSRSGSMALQTGNDNTWMGQGSGYQSSSDGSVFIGFHAGYGADGVQNIFIGKAAGENTTGSTGASNTAIGTSSLNHITSGAFNTAFGRNTLFNLTTGSQNTILGTNSAQALTSGSQNLALGYSLEFPSNTANGQMTIQNIIFGTGNTGTGTTVSTGSIGIGVPVPQAKLDVAGDIRIGSVAVDDSNDNILVRDGTTGKVEIRDASSLFPSQTGNSGKFLTTDGTVPSWASLIGAATESGTSLRIGSGSTFTSSRVTSIGVNAGSSVGQDNFYAGYNVKGGSTSGSFNTLIGTKINDVSAFASLGSSIHIGYNIQPYVTNSVSILPTGGEIRYTAGTIIGTGITLPTSGTWSAAASRPVIIGSNITDNNASQTVKKHILIGSGIDMSGQANGGRAIIISSDPTLQAGIQNSVGIGTQISLLDGQPHVTVIGPNAKAYVDATYGATGGHQVSVGYNAYSGAWRATSIGGYSQALAVSSTSLGYGTYTNKPHGTTIGRGGYNDVENSTLFYIDNVYFGGIGSAWTNPAMPGTEVVDNSAAQNAGTYITRLYGRPGRDANLVPTLSNVRGGHIRWIGGPSTGTAKGGHIQLATTPAGAVSSNTENTEVVAVEIDAEAYSAGTVETRFLLLDLSDGTVKRVSFGADDSGGAGYKVLRIAN